MPGSTKVILYISIINIIPILLNPSILSIPISNVFVSTLTNNRLYNNTMLNNNNMNIIILRIIPKNIDAYFNGANSLSTGNVIIKGNTPNSSAIPDANLVNLFYISS